MGRTHMAFGFLAGVLLLPILGGSWFLFLPLAVFGSLLPDVDHQNSKINRLFPVTSWVPLFFKHRGFFHSVFPVLILFFLFDWFNLSWVGIPLCVGYVAHLLSDCLTKMGCNLLHPFSTFRVQGFIETGGLAEYVVFGFVWCLNVIVVVNSLF